MVRRARWSTVGIGVSLLSVGSTLITSPSQAASDYRAINVSDTVGRSSAVTRSLGGGTASDLGTLFGALLAQMPVAPLMQTVPLVPAQQFGPVPDARGPMPPAPQLNAPQVVPTLGPTSPAANAPAAGVVLAGAGPTFAPQLTNLSNVVPAGGPQVTTAVLQPVSPGGQPATNGPVPLTGVIGSAAGPIPVLGSTTNPPGGNNVTTALNTAGGNPVTTALNTTGGTATNASMANSSASNAGSSGSSGSSRILPNLPGTPNQNRIVGIAQAQLGARYTWAGVSPSTGFDCSGFVYYVYNTYGFSLDRTMPDQFNAGRRVRMEDLRPGDIVFFADTYMPGLSHNGIYIGDGKFIHAVDESVGVAITPLNSAYWESRYAGAVHIVD